MESEGIRCCQQRRRRRREKCLAVRVSGCRDRVGPAGGRGVMQGVGGDSSVSHGTRGVTSSRLAGTERDGGGECEWSWSQRRECEIFFFFNLCMCV